MQFGLFSLPTILEKKKRLGIMDVQYLKQMQTMDEQAATVEAAVHKRPKLLWINFLLTATLLVCLILEVMRYLFYLQSLLLLLL